jgi:hypothetical protein
MPREDWQGILDAVRSGTEKSELLCSGEVASEIANLSSTIDSIVDGSIETFENSRLTKVMQYAFIQCVNLKSVVLPNVAHLMQQAFRQCTKLERADFSNLVSMETYAFYGASTLKTLIIRTNTVCNLVNTMAFTGTPIKEGEGYIYVPAALLEEYKQATNWTTLEDNIRAIEDYPEITGGAI